MLFKVGELAKRAGITVRTLHHYESTGLLTPSARTPAGYRLYNREDITRLHTIQALTRMGLSLNAVRECLEDNRLSLSDIIDTQLSMLDAQLTKITRLHQRLTILQQTINDGAEPSLSEWLKTLELMNMYDKYFTAEELKQLPFAQPNPQRDEEWVQLVKDAKSLMSRKIATNDPLAQALACRWMSMIERDTAGNADFFNRLNKMHFSESEVQDQTGITHELMGYIIEAFSWSKLTIYRRYLNDEEYAFTEAHYFDRITDWPPLVAEIREAVAQHCAPDSDTGRRLIQQWLTLFTSFAGNNPETHQKFRLAMMQEPELSQGSWMTPEMFSWLRQAMEALQKTA